MKVLQINPVVRQNTSTGKIMAEIGNILISHGDHDFLAYSGGRSQIDKSDVETQLMNQGHHLLPVGTLFSVGWHFIMTRFFDMHGLGSRCATRFLIKKIKSIAPDVIHIHNIHGYFLNYRILFEFLSKSNIPVVWTVHDCWLFTGHCYHYASVGCYKWQNLCQNCPQKKSFPTSVFLDRSMQNYYEKKQSFTSVNNITFVTVSEWMKGEMRMSFLKDCSIKVIHNGIDLNLFRYTDAECTRSKYNISARNIILGVASIWLKEKGIEDFVLLSELLGDDEAIVLVGKMTEAQRSLFNNKKVILINRTDNASELASLYSMSIALVNPTWQDNYPTVNMESIACGTPVITYHTGGSVETITEDTGFVVEQGDVLSLYKKYQVIRQKGKQYYLGKCRRYAELNFAKEDRYNDYLKLYEDIRSR